MRKCRYLHSFRRVTGLAATVLAVALIGSVGLRAHAQNVNPLSDSWKGDKLDAKWHVTLLGDAQDQESSIKLENGLLRLRAGGSDIWGDHDNGIYLWQTANGDFQITLEMRNITKTDEAAKVGIMVRASLDSSSANVFLQGMPKGGNMQIRQATGDADTGPGSGCPGDECNPWGDNSGDITTMPTIMQRLTRVGKQLTAERSYDGGKTWGGLHTGSLADANDKNTIELPDDVLVGIAMTSHNAGEVGEALIGPLTFVSTATRPTDNGLLAVIATDANGKPAASTGVILKKGSDIVGTSVGPDVTSNTASFFLKPGAYTIATAESDTFAAGTPVPVEIKTGQVAEIKVPAGKAK